MKTTPRKAEALKLRSEGKSYKDIASAMGIGYQAARIYCIMGKIDLEKQREYHNEHHKVLFSKGVRV